MSIVRLKSKLKNESVYLQNRLTRFTNPPMRTGDLYVEKNEVVYGDLDVCGNLVVGQNLTATNFYARGNYYLNNYILIPAGTIIQSASINEPEGWLDCDGRRLNFNDYSNLFNAIRYTYGGSDSSFNIPDARGRSSIGLGNGAGLTNRTLGMTGGEETHTLTTGEMPIHNHNITDPGHNHNWNNGVEGDDSGNGGSYSEYTLVPGNVPNVIASATTGITINNSGSGQSHNVMQPFIVFRYLIKY